MHPRCVMTALNGYGLLTVPEVKARVEAIQSMVNKGVCPRCDGSVVRVAGHLSPIGDTCLPICNTDIRTSRSRSATGEMLLFWLDRLGGPTGYRRRVHRRAR